MIQLRYRIQIESPDIVRVATFLRLWVEKCYVRDFEPNTELGAAVVKFVDDDLLVNHNSIALSIRRRFDSDVRIWNAILSDPLASSLS